MNLLRAAPQALFSMMLRALEGLCDKSDLEAIKDTETISVIDKAVLADLAPRKPDRPGS